MPSSALPSAQVRQPCIYQFNTYLLINDGNVALRLDFDADKALVKEVVKNYAKEILADQLDEIAYDTIKEQVVKAGGANYGM